MENNDVRPVISKWYKRFLYNPQQRVKITDIKPKRTEVNGGVPQGTVCDLELFMHTVTDLNTSVPNGKYVNQTTFAEVCVKGESSELQQTAKKIIE